jgi:anti-sigma B factor antagonist
MLGEGGPVTERGAGVEPLSIDVFESDGVVVLTVTGELDASECELLDEAIGRGSARAARAVVLDLGAVSYMDSSGLRSIVEGAATAERAGARFAVGRTSPAVHRILEICGMEEAFVMSPMSSPRNHVRRSVRA